MILILVHNDLKFGFIWKVFRCDFWTLNEILIIVLEPKTFDLCFQFFTSKYLQILI